MSAQFIKQTAKDYAMSISDVQKIADTSGDDYDTFYSQLESVISQRKAA
jgi:hypothetical protein